MEGNRFAGNGAEERLSEVSATDGFAKGEHPQILHCLAHGVQAQGFPAGTISAGVDQRSVAGWDEIIAVGVQIRVDMVIGILRVPEIIPPVQKTLNAVLPELNAKNPGVAQALCNHTPCDMVIPRGGAAVIDPQPGNAIFEERIGVFDRGNRFL